jgi:hypothetical protein
LIPRADRERLETMPATTTGLDDRGPAAPAVFILVTGMVPSGRAAVNSNIGCRPVVSRV